MQTLIPLTLALSLASGTPLSLLPYAYLSSPLPVYHHFQNTRTGEHAYSYAGGPSAKEEIKDADGVLRGSYSYVDANGILQSAFYVADENGFRVAATNLPSDDNLNVEPAHIILARNTDAQEVSRSDRKRRSLEASGLSQHSQQEQHQVLQKDDKQALPTILWNPLLLTNDIPTATSHQSQVQVHSNARLDVTESEAKAKPVDLQSILPVQTILGGLPILARAPTYHENRIELHKELGIEGPRPRDAVKIDPEPLTILHTPSVALPVASTIIAREALPVLPILSKEALPVLPAAHIGTTSVTTTISSHGVSQIHGHSKLSNEALAISGLPNVVAKESLPVAAEKDVAIVKEAIPVVPIAKEPSNLATSTVTTSISSHGISQIHPDSKLNIEPTLLVKTAPIAQLHPVVSVLSSTG